MRALTKTTGVVFQISKYRDYCVDRILLMYVIYCERREMRNLSDETLNDIGIDRDQLRREYSRNISDIPENRINSRYSK